MALSGSSQDTASESWFVRALESTGLFAAGFALLLAVSAATALLSTLNHDVGWFLWCAGRLLEGGRFGVDVVDINPPLTAWLTIPPVFLARLTGASEILVFKLYVLALAGLSLGVSRHVMVKTGVPETTWQRRVLLAAALLFLVAVSTSYFGQREHLMFMLVLPYVFLGAGRAGKREFGRAAGVLVGLLAGLGIALKPYFLIFWLGLEGYLRLVRGARPFWRRAEGVTVSLVQVLFGVTVLLLTPRYLSVVLVAMQVYQAYDARIAFLLLRSETLLACAALAAFAVARRVTPGTTLRTALLVTMVCFFAIALIQRKGFYYHFYPSNAAAGLLLVTSMLGLIGASSRRWRSFLVVLTALGLLFQSARVTRRAVLASGHWEASIAGRLCRTVKERAPGGPIVVLSSSLYPAFPLVNYSGARWAYRGGCLLELPGLVAGKSTPGSERSELERRLIDGVVEDLQKHRPRLVIVDESPGKQGFGERSFDFLEYFLKDRRFAELWRRYEYVESVENFKVYRLRPAGPERGS